ncbi:hypothetical protein [Leptospira ilyithenensis]|uniref:hypothetical protein n=1 Tax=Leptospira ilyithenensis TaxID=2484901 RepID=UPI0014386705|nr:hypothetical protein [Leptospira ilyithenensis]
MTYETRHATIEDLDRPTAIFTLYRIFYKQAQSIYEKNGFEKDEEFYHYFVSVKN